MSTASRDSAAGELILVVALASFTIGLLIGLRSLLEGLTVGAAAPVLTVSPVGPTAVIAGTLGAAAIIPAGLVLSIRR